MNFEGRTSDFLERLKAGVPSYCGKEDAPGIDEVPEWRDWSFRETTPDQTRIESFLENGLLAGKHVLHVGIGNSSLARRFYKQFQHCIGISIANDEVQLANSLSLPNYEVYCLNKYSLAFLELCAPVDVIIDNNPSSYGCCYLHFTRLLEAYSRKLRPGGMIISDKIGLRFVSSANKSPDAWRMSVGDWSSVTSLLGFETSSPDGYVTVSTRVSD